MASLITVRKRPFSSSYKAEAVVPDGDVTLLRRIAGCSPVSMAYKVDPNIVWYTNVVALSRGKPICTPASDAVPMQEESNRDEFFIPSLGRYSLSQSASSNK
jgi:hypothetical protein